MKLSIVYYFLGILFLCTSCSTAQTSSNKKNLTATEFSEKINETPQGLILDVRTPEEFSEGHIKNAKNINWNSDYFNSQTAKLNKSEPVFVYCLSGGRSAAAASKLRSDGFKTVYELNGGILKWRTANLREETTSPVTENGMTRAQFNKLIDSDKLVLIDYNADWCIPCQKMKPYLDEISRDMKDKVIVVGINIDKNKALAKELKIDALPVLELYKNKKIVWNNIGLASKEKIVKELNSH